MHKDGKAETFRQPRFAALMDPSRKDRGSGVTTDPLAVQMSVPRAELMPSAHERLLLLGSTIHRKRMRRPKVDIHENPACAERRLTDAYELMRTNRNPAIYRPTKAELARSTAILDKPAKQAASADVIALKLRVLESIGAEEDATNLRRGLHDGSVARGGLDVHALAAESIPHFQTYTRPSDAGAGTGGNHQPTYGHPHLPRIYNPLAHDLTRRGPKAEPRSGMSVAQLQGLLKGGSSRSRGRAVVRRGESSAVASEDGYGSRALQVARSPSSQVAPPSGGSVSLDLDYTAFPVDAGERAERGWDASFSAPLTVIENRNPLPHPGASALARDEALAEPFGLKLRRSRAVAAGTLLPVASLCETRQKNDREDMSFLGTGHVRTQGALKQELSPRREYQRAELRKILAERKERDAEALGRVGRHALDETMSRIPEPPPLTLDVPRAVWNPSPLLGESPY